MITVTNYKVSEPQLRIDYGLIRISHNIFALKIKKTCGAKIQLNQSFPFGTMIEFQMPCALNFRLVQALFENKKKCYC